jgi:hypothetical protein
MTQLRLSRNDRLINDILYPFPDLVRVTTKLILNSFHNGRNRPFTCWGILVSVTLHVVLGSFVYGVVCEVHLIMALFAVAVLVFDGGKTSESFFVKVDSEGVALCYENVDSEIKL